MPLKGVVNLVDGLCLGKCRRARVSATPANTKPPATWKEPRYLIFWSSPERAGELAERVGIKGDGKTRLLGFGLPNATYELEGQLPSRIRVHSPQRVSTTWR